MLKAAAVGGKKKKKKTKQTNMKEKDDYIWKKSRSSLTYKKNKVKTEAVLYSKNKQTKKAEAV